MVDINKVREEIAALQDIVAKEEERLAGMSEIQKQAEYLHDITCTFNHDDGCGWFYEEWPKQGMSYPQYSTKKSYVDRVVKIKGKMHGHYGGSFEDAVEIYKIVRGY